MIVHCENWGKHVTADRDGKWNRLFLGRRWAKNSRSVKIWQKNRKLLVKRKLLRWISLARRARIVINEKEVREGTERRGEGDTRDKNDGGFWAAKAQKSVNDRFYVCSFDTRSSHLHRRRLNRQLSKHENQRWLSLSFMMSLIVRSFNQKLHFFYDYSTRAFNSICIIECK